MPDRLIVAYGLIMLMIAAAAYGIFYMRRQAAARRLGRRAHRRGPVDLS